MLAWLTISLLVGVAIGTRFVPTADELRAAFEQGQKFYASGAYDQAIERYRLVASSDSEMLDEKAVRVAVGEIDAPQDEVARYQIGNAFFKMAEDALQRRQVGLDGRQRTEAVAMADSLLARAAGYFLETEKAATVRQLRALARSRVVTCRYRMRDFQGTIEEARQLLEGYPESGHVEQAMYDIGWSLYEMEHFGESIAAFSALVARFPGGYRANRALFQIGEAHFALGKGPDGMEHFPAAISHYRRLVESQGLERMSERDILRMKREKLAGLVDETALDLAAKALIRIGMCYEKTGEYAAAADAFERIATQFADERRLVEEAYRRQADMYYSQGDLEACIDVYRRAVEAQDDAAGRARMQLLLANRYFETGFFTEAIEEYRTYAYTYPELAARVGLPLEGAGLQIAKARFGLAESGAPSAAREHYRQAELELRRTLAAWPDTDFAGELRFNLGLAVQLQGGEDRLAEAVTILAQVRSEEEPGGFGRSALFQMARIRTQQGKLELAADDYRALIEECDEAPEGDVARFELGVLQDRSGDWQAAVDRLLSVRPGSVLYARSRLEAGQVLARNDERQRAIESFLDGLQVSADSEEKALHHYLVGATQAQLGRHEEALEHFEEAVGLAGPDLAERALYGRAATAFKLGQYRTAATYLDRAWEDEEMSAAARRLLAAAHATLGQGGQAMEVYASLAQDATEPLERAEYTLALAEIAYRQGDYDRATAACDSLLQLAYPEQDPNAQRPYYLREKALFLAADARVRQGDFAGARRATQTGLADFPDAFYAPDFLFLDGMSALQLEANDVAASRLQAMLRRFPEHESAPYARYYLAYAFFNQTRFETAREHFGAVVRLTPELEVAPDAAFRRAECYYNMEQYVEAGEAYREVIRRYPDSPLREDALYNIAWCALNALPAGDAAPDMGPVREAFLAYLDEYPEGSYLAMAQYTLAEIRFNEGGYDQAYDLFTRIEEGFPESEAALQAQQFMPRLLEAIAYREYAAVADELNRALDGEEDDLLRQLIPRLEQVWAKFPETASGVGAKLNIGVCYQNLREWKAAVETFETIIAAGGEGNEQVTTQVLGFSERRRDMIARRHL